jgi:L-aminopeptidase/D-esterase-like protein
MKLSERSLIIANKPVNDLDQQLMSPKRFFSFLAVILIFITAGAQTKPTKPRARDLGIPFDGIPGQFNAITDVAGVEVGLVTLISGEGKLVPGKGPVRTGVTAVLPRGKNSTDQVFGAWFTLNGNGEMTGTTWVEESGFLEGPIMITNTHSVGTVRDAVIAWQMKKQGATFQPWSLPIVAETYDGFLNDINGFHVKPEHAAQALDQAAGFKAGTGTSSRRFEIGGSNYTVGVLVQANYGARQRLTIAGVPVGREIQDLVPKRGSDGTGSIIVVVATDVPLLPHQLKRVVKRASLGIAKNGGLGENSSGDIFIAFSTANAGAGKESTVATLKMLPNDRINPVFAATVQATEEAIINALVAAETISGVDGNTAYAIPHDRLKQIMKKYNRLQ